MRRLENRFLFSLRVEQRHASRPIRKRLDGSKRSHVFPQCPQADDHTDGLPKRLTDGAHRRRPHGDRAHHRLPSWIDSSGQVPTIASSRQFTLASVQVNPENTHLRWRSEVRRRPAPRALPEKLTSMWRRRRCVSAMAIASLRQRRPDSQACPPCPPGLRLRWSS